MPTIERNNGEMNASIITIYANINGITYFKTRKMIIKESNIIIKVFVLSFFMLITFQEALKLFYAISFPIFAPLNQTLICLTS